MAIRHCNQSSWYRRNGKHPTNYRNRFDYKYFICLCSIIFCPPSLAESTSVAANPQAAITGSVANQAVQINQGSLSTQSFGNNIFCNGPVMSITPYVMSTESFTSSFSNTNNYGAQISLSMPLDGGAVERCKHLAQIQIDKGRLDYELVRIKECINIFEKGFSIHPSSPFYPVCSDVIPLASRVPKSEQAPSL